MAVPPLGSRRRSAARTASRSVRRRARAPAAWLNATAPTRMLRGHGSQEVVRGARGRPRAAMGCTSVACIEPEMSVTSRTDARSSGTAMRRLRPREGDDERRQRERVQPPSARAGASPGACARPRAAPAGARSLAARAAAAGGGRRRPRPAAARARARAGRGAPGSSRRPAVARAARRAHVERAALAVAPDLTCIWSPGLLARRSPSATSSGSATAWPSTPVITSPVRGAGALRRPGRPA